MSSGGSKPLHRGDRVDVHGRDNKSWGKAEPGTVVKVERPTRSRVYTVIMDTGEKLQPLASKMSKHEPTRVREHVAVTAERMFDRGEK